MPEHSAYETLEIGPDAGPDEIRRAYRRLAALYHPDRDPSPEARARWDAVQDAYRSLLPSAEAEPDRPGDAYETLGLGPEARAG